MAPVGNAPAEPSGVPGACATLIAGYVLVLDACLIELIGLLFMLRRKRNAQIAQSNSFGLGKSTSQQRKVDCVQS